jgi:hypothetical protein
MLSTVAVLRHIKVIFRPMKNLARRELKKRCRGRLVRDVAQEIGVSRQFLFAVLGGTKLPGPKLLDYLGLERYEAYRRKRSQPNASST